MKRKIMAEVEVEIDNDQLQEIIKKLEKQVKSLETKIKRRDREIDEFKRKYIVLESRYNYQDEFVSKIKELFQLAYTRGYMDCEDETEPDYWR